jgi:hypothetical protein
MMRVLIVEGAAGAGPDARQALTEAGHEVTSCHNDGPSFPCHGMSGGPGCPIESGGGVDVAVLVRDQPGSEPTITEDGVRCALRHHVPLAVTGAVEDNPYTPFAVEVSSDADDVVAVAERSATAPLAPHTRAARAALRAVLAGEDLDVSLADALVERHGSMLTVTLIPGAELDPMLLETASVRALAAVRAIDRAASIIDVTVSTPTGSTTRS